MDAGALRKLCLAFSLEFKMNRISLALVFVTWFLQSMFVEASAQPTNFVPLDAVPPAAPGTVDGYYDIQTGDVLISIGSDVLLFGVPFEPVSTVPDETFAENVGVFDASLVNIESALGPPQQNDGGGIAWLNFSAFPVGVHNLGPMLKAFPRGAINASSQAEFEANLSFLYGDFVPEISYVDQIAGSAAERRTFGVIRPRFEAAVVPEPCSALLIPLVGGAVLLRRRKT